jgi:hypothetical protein
MRKRTEPTIVEKAIESIDGFEKVYRILQQQLSDVLFKKEVFLTIKCKNQ